MPCIYGFGACGLMDDCPTPESCNKPKVYYGKIAYPIQVGVPAILDKVFSHHDASVRGTGYVRTSDVVRIFEDGVSFETLNTIYVPKE